MSNLSSLCLTCLSNLEEGARLTETLTNFLCNILHFKLELLQESSKIICRKCYKSLIEVKCFYTQLRDVEVYFETKSKINHNPNDFIKEEATEEPYIGELECTVSIADETKLEPILIDEDEECCVVEDDHALTQKKTSATGKRFVCLTCSKLFGSFEDLHSHERTHNRQSMQKALPIFVAANSPAPQQVTSSECKQDLSNKTNLERNTIKNQNKIRPFCCKNCKHRFAKKELLVHHEAKYKCEICHNKCCSRKALDVHMKEKHNGNTNGLPKCT